jgi:16S rRNA (cytidine1402-2'-O)-methyltransferase
MSSPSTKEVQGPANRPPLAPGTLYLVATPIGNLEDITLRALRTLKECDVVAAEDTRRTGLLLQHFDIRKPLISYFRFNEARRSEEIVERLGRGERIALVTDAGSPGISDPGQRVVSAVLRAGLRIEAVPGACALVAALTASGLETDEFHFAGFLPHKSGQRRRRLEQLRAIAGTLVLYESPYRVEKLLAELADLMPTRQVTLARELTKKFEEFRRGTPGELLSTTKGRVWKGELTVLIGGEGDVNRGGGSGGPGVVSTGTHRRLRRNQPRDLMTLRPYEPTDEEAVIELWERCDLVRPWNDPRKDIRRKLAVQPDLFLVGVEHERLVATVMVGYEGHRGWINYLAVDPDCQQRGYGRALMVEAERKLRECGCPKINLQVRPTNRAVIEFYQRLGFVVEESISMGKRLEQDGTRLGSNAPSDLRADA